MAYSESMQEMLPEGALLQGGKYQVVRRIASGGFGNTYEVVNTEFEERQAMKEFFMRGVSERLDDQTSVAVSNTQNRGQFEQQREKFRKEARRLRQLHNAHIVQVHDLFQENGTAYYAMDYVDGESLEARTRRMGPMGEEEVMRLLPQVLDALATVHAQGIWHLDLKPGNIMQNRQGDLLLIDFGASKQMKSVDGLSTTTAMCYTPGYAPPEQMDQKMELLGPWTDIYALGGTLYSMLTAQRPPTLSEMQEPTAFRYPSPVSDKTQYLIRWMMLPQRSQRPQSVDEVRRFLAAPFTPQPVVNTVVDDNATVLQPVQSAARKSSATKWVLLALGSMAVGALLWLLLAGGGDTAAAVADVAGEEEAVDEPAEVSNLYFESAYGACSYTGPVDADGKPHGRGEATFADGRLYRGPFAHGVMQGDDAVFTFGNGDSFKGTFQNNHFHEGRYTFADDGSYFVGTFSDGQPDHGTWYNRDGSVDATQ